MAPASDQRELYAAFKSKDRRFDGRFFVGVSSTGIYCRPVCRAKMPKAENCSFYGTAAEAERAGYRPCLICRPELAPGRSITDATATLAHRAARLIEESCGENRGLDALAGKLGYTSRHLRRVFQAEYHVSPLQYRETCRLLLAKNLLTDTGLSVADVALTAGFGSLRRFNDSFKKRYRLSPTALRKRAAREGQPRDEVTLLLGYRPPYRWNEMLRFLAERAIPGVETVRKEEYLRTVQHLNASGERVYGWIRVGRATGKDALRVTVSANLLGVLPRVLARLRHLFDLYCDPDAVAETLESMNDLAPGLFVPGIRVPGCYDPFEMAVRAILGQQISVKAAGTLAGRLAQTYGHPLQTGIDGLDVAFPPPERMAGLGSHIVDGLGSLGIIASRSKALYELALAFTEGTVTLGPDAQPQAEKEKLMSLPGIGAWTAEYLAMRAMGWPDAFLSTDHGVKKALASLLHEGIGKRSTQPERSALSGRSELSDTWRPWRSYATISLWNSL
jgi:AraC family transcriptional regulator of adaptative response / DNA-3-methyladenine glycosylase II